MKIIEKDIDSKGENSRKQDRDSRLRTGFLVLGSALFGGIAVALWNRRTLASIRNPLQESEFKPTVFDDDAIY